ncbi:MAG: SDR family NAD(P)-dependent oxidoreductase, partial [Flavitalea sp.]
MKKVLITGANKGIGFEVARQLAVKGYKIFIGSRDQIKGEIAVRKLRDEGLTNVELLLIDVANPYSVIAAGKELESKIDSLDILINNAAIAGQLPQTFVDGDSGNLRAVYESNFFGLIQTTQQFIPLLKKSESAEIVNVSSELGSLSILSEPGIDEGWTFYDAYGSSKVAVNAFTVMLANQLRSTNIRVNSVTPGYSATDLNNFSGQKTAAEGAGVISEFIVSKGKGISGKFYGDAGEINW